VTSPKKRVAYISLNRFNTMLCDGVSNSSLELLRFLKTQGHDVAVFIFFTDEPYRRFVFQHLAGGRPVDGRSYTAVLKGIPIHQEWLPFGEQTLLANQRLFLKAVTTKVRKERVDLALTAEDDFLTLFAVSVLAVPGAHYFHSLSYIGHFRQFPLLIKLLKKRAVFAASRFLQKKVEEILGISAEVWYPLFDLDRWAVPRLDGPSASLGFYSAGEHKGDSIVNRLIRMKPEWEFTVVGRSYGPPEGATPSNLRFRGDTSDYREFYGRVRILLVPSLQPEGFPRVILEAAANGIPVVANRIGGISVDFDQGRTSGADLDSLAQIYLREAARLLSEPEHYQELSRLARLRAQEYQSAQRDLSRHNYERYFDL
jgi:glycosyltransferase involved in cell wall biosynthesis